MDEKNSEDWVKDALNQCFTIIRENKDNYVRLETLIRIEVLFEMIQIYHLNIPVPNRKFYAKVLSLIRTKRHYFKVTMDNEYLEKEFGFSNV